MRVRITVFLHRSTGRVNLNLTLVTAHPSTVTQPVTELLLDLNNAHPANTGTPAYGKTQTANTMVTPVEANC